MNQDKKNTQSKLPEHLILQTPEKSSSVAEQLRQRMQRKSSTQSINSLKKKIQTSYKESISGKKSSEKKESNTE